MSVHYKFKTSLEHNSVSFDGMGISVADLKKSILHQKKMGKCSGFELKLMNAQTEEVYNNDETLIPRNTSIIVSRLPVQDGTKNKKSDQPDLPLPINQGNFGLIRYDRIIKKADLVNSNATEEDKVKAMIHQSSQEYDPSKYLKTKNTTGPAPFGYTCNRCGQQGNHWVQNCPTHNVKRSTGIPRSFMVTVDGPEHKGALLTSSGSYAIPLINLQLYSEVKKEKPPFVPQDEPVVEPKAQVPKELLCMVCNELLRDAVSIPCCGNSFCDECVRQVLLDSENHECPVCHRTKVSPNTLVPNRFLRNAVAKYYNGQKDGLSILFKKAPSLPQPASSVPKEGNFPQVSPDSTAISTIETITNVCNKRQYSHSANLHPEFPNQRPHQDDWSGYDREDYHGRYKQKPERSSRRTHYYRSDGESRYTSSTPKYSSSETEHSDSSYDVSHYEKCRSRHRREKYMPPLGPLIIPPPFPVPAVPPIYSPAILFSGPQALAPQWSPSGASPILTAQIPSQPPPPGVGPSLLKIASLAYRSQPFDKEDPHKVERSMDDRRLREFQRKLERYSRNGSPRRRSRSSDSHRSRSSFGSRKLSKTRRRTRSTTRSFTRSRSRSRKRSYSSSRITTKSRSRDRRREGTHRRHRSARSRGHPRSSSPKRHRHSSRRSDDGHSQYSPHHTHSQHSPIHSRPIELYSPKSMTYSSLHSAQYDPQNCQHSQEGQRDSKESVHQKHSPIRAPGTDSDHSQPLKREDRDEFSFEPDHEFSDAEEKSQSKHKKHKHKEEKKSHKSKRSRHAKG